MGVGPPVVALLIALMQGAFCKTWDMSLPQSIVGVSGSCITIPCRFEVPDDQEGNMRNCSGRGVWRKGSPSGPLVLGARSSLALQGRIIGDLTKKNCTTVIDSFPQVHSGLFFFRLDCSESLRFTFTNGLNITAQPGAPPPLLAPVAPVSEGEQVRLRCSVPVPCSTLPPSIAWHPVDGTQQEQTLLQQSKDRQTIMTSTLTFAAAAAHHNRTITCSVSQPLAGGGVAGASASTQRLHVLYAPTSTVATLSARGPVPEGDDVTFTCSSDANPPVSLYTWYRADAGQLVKVGEGDVLVLRVSQWDTGEYLCEAQTNRGSQRSTPVSLKVSATTGGDAAAVVLPYVLCAVVLVLYILTLIVDVYKYKSLSRRLKIELKGEHTYADLRTRSVASDYDRLQPRTKPPPDTSHYGNLQIPAATVNLQR